MQQNAPIDIISKPLGFKLMLAGTASWMGSAIANLDWAQVVGFIVAVIGVLMQFAAYKRNQKAEKRELELHRLQVAVLKKQLEPQNDSGE